MMKKLSPRAATVLSALTAVLASGFASKTVW
jgi:hypothetical protein